MATLGERVEALEQFAVHQTEVNEAIIMALEGINGTLERIDGRLELFTKDQTEVNDAMLGYLKDIANQA